MPTAFSNGSLPAVYVAFQGDVTADLILHLWRAWDRIAPLRAGPRDSDLAHMDLSEAYVRERMPSILANGTLRLHLPPMEGNADGSGRWFSLRLDWKAGPDLYLPPKLAKGYVDAKGPWRFMRLTPEDDPLCHFNPQSDGDYLYENAKILVDALDAPFAFGDDALATQLMHDLSDPRGVAWALNYYGPELVQVIGKQLLTHEVLFENILDSPHVDPTANGGVWVVLGVDCFDVTVKQFDEKKQLAEFLGLWRIFGEGNELPRPKAAG